MRAARVDLNQSLIVAAFRAHGCLVAHTHTVGKGFPDITVGYPPRNIVAIVEIKDGPKAKLTGPETLFHQAWSGLVEIVRSVEDVAALVGKWKAGL